MTFTGAPGSNPFVNSFGQTVSPLSIVNNLAYKQNVTNVFPNIRNLMESTVTDMKNSLNVNLSGTYYGLVPAGYDLSNYSNTFPIFNANNFIVAYQVGIPINRQVPVTSLPINLPGNSQLINDFFTTLSSGVPSSMQAFVDRFNQYIAKRLADAVAGADMNSIGNTIASSILNDNSLIALQHYTSNSSAFQNFASFFNSSDNSDQFTNWDGTFVGFPPQQNFSRPTNSIGEFLFPENVNHIVYYGQPTLSVQASPPSQTSIATPLTQGSFLNTFTQDWMVKAHLSEGFGAVDGFDTSFEGTSNGTMQNWALTFFNNFVAHTSPPNIDTNFPDFSFFQWLDQGFTTYAVGYSASPAGYYKDFADYWDANNLTQFSTANFLEYKGVFDAFFPSGHTVNLGNPPHDFREAAYAFHFEMMSKYGYVDYNLQFQDWVQFMTHQYVAENPKANTLLVGMNASKTIIIVELYKIISSLLNTVQQVTAAQANRLVILSNWQKAYTSLLAQVPVFTAGKPLPDGDGGGSINQNDRGVLNNTVDANYRTQIQTLQSLVSDDAKTLQSNLNQSNDAQSQQSNYSTSLIQELSTLLGSIFR